MWTRPQIKEFKEKVLHDQDAVITVGKGEVLTVRVPTHQDGSHLFWEFATDPLRYRFWAVLWVEEHDHASKHWNYWN